MRSLVVLTALILPAAAAAQSDSTRALPVAHAVRASSAIRLDGNLDEPAWRDAPVTDDFTQIDPEEGKPASQRTEVRVVYDDDALYVGVRLHDTGHVTARLGAAAAARDAMNLVGEWLRSGDPSPYRFLETPERVTTH